MSRAGVIKTLSPRQIKFCYRSSAIADDEIILSAELTLHKSLQNVINKKLLSYRVQRRTQPWGFSTGCVFKNPRGRSAGALIDQAGYKGKKVGGAMVSPVHANFIINRDGKARARDVWKLIRDIQAAVKKKFGVKLELEIKLWGDFS